MDKGAHFFRCDFQVHTPRDQNWSGSRPDTAEERRDFAERLVAACREKGIGAVAVTDHHDFAYFPIIKDATLREVDGEGRSLSAEHRLVVFPGIELTLGVPCQALLILDADFPTDQLNVVLEALAITVTDATEPRLPPVQRVDHIDSFKKLYADLDNREWLRGRYIVLPNVTDRGYGSLMRSAMHPKYKEMPCVGGYLDGSVNDIGTGNRQIFGGKNSSWGNKRIAVFPTSDARSESFADLGRNTTWVKWAAPSAEALRQACLAEESRISHEAPGLPTTFVTRLSVSNSKFMGPIELELNPQYNAIIGGRGTGKSTCLEYLRWALCDQPVNGRVEDEVSGHAARRERLIAATLAPFEGHVDVHFLLNGIPHVVRRSTGADGLKLKVGDGDFAPAREDDIRSLLPIQAYSQKQLSGISVRIDELTRFVTSPIRRKLEEIDAQADTLAGRTRENYAALQRQRSLAVAIERDELTTASLAKQASNLRESLEGVSEDDQAIVAQKPAHDVADGFAANWERKVEQASSEVERFESAVRKLQTELRETSGEDLPSKAILDAMEAGVRQLFSDLERTADEAKSDLSKAQSSESAYAKARTTWQEAHDDYERRYATAKTRSAAQQSKLEELEQLERRTKQVGASLDEQREELAGLSDPGARHAQLRSEWLRIQEERSRNIAEQCTSLTELSGETIRASLNRGAGLAELIDAFTIAVRGSAVRGSKIEAFVAGLMESEDPIAAWESALDELEPSGAELRKGDGGPRWPTLTHLGFSVAEIEKMVERLSPEGWLELALRRVDDHPKFEYKTKDGQSIDFTDASLGQQATALLRVLLSQSGPPLIIDQPEEDLDSQIVLEIVEQIWTAKTTRQLIFSSHNPNLVVNGDAELVICCDYRAVGDASGGKIKLEGAIDIPEVKDAITSVMEGGKTAFRLRKEKYGF